MSERTANPNTSVWTKRLVKGVGVLAGAAMVGGALTACTPNTAPVPTVIATKTAEASATPKPTTVESTPGNDILRENSELGTIADTVAPQLAADVISLVTDKKVKQWSSISDGIKSEPGTFTVQSFIDTRTSLPGDAGKKGEYTILATVKKNGSGAFDPQTVNRLWLGAQVNRSGIDGPGENRHNVFSYTLDRKADGSWGIAIEPEADPTLDTVRSMRGAIRRDTGSEIQAPLEGETTQLSPEAFKRYSEAAARLIENARNRVPVEQSTVS